jgi:hypothetical protein
MQLVKASNFQLNIVPVSGIYILNLKTVNTISPFLSHGESVHFDRTTYFIKIHFNISYYNSNCCFVWV